MRQPVRPDDSNQHQPATAPVTSITAKKLEANQRNAQLSTGPRTMAGKAHSRLNALKHGILAMTVVIDNGERQKFNRLLAHLYHHYCPVGPMEEFFVERIATLEWRLGRVGRSEQGEIREQLEIDPGKLPPADIVDLHARYETMVSREFHRALSQLERLQRLRQGDKIPAPMSRI